MEAPIPGDDERPEEEEEEECPRETSSAVPPPTDSVEPKEVSTNQSPGSPLCDGEPLPTPEEDDTAEDPSAGEDRQCPVCLTLVDSLVCGPCRHPTCLPCMEQILNSNGDQKRWPPQSASDEHLAAPTLGRCPICRGELSLFELVDAATAPTGPFLFPKQLDYCREANTPLKDSVYIPYYGRVGQLSFHWDWSRLRDTPHKRERPFFNLATPLAKNPDRWRLDNGELPPRIVYFEPGHHFHAATRTFHGTIRWGDEARLNGSDEWDVVLGFPRDYRFVSRGRIHMKRGRRIAEEEEKALPAAYTSEQRQLCRFPMDGRWTVSWKTDEGEPRRSEIHVVNNEYKQSRWSFYLNWDDPEHPAVRWPRSRHVQTVQEGVDLRTNPMGPPVGSRVRWTTTSPTCPELTWERQTVGPVPTPKVILFGMGVDRQLYQRLHADLGSSVVPRHHGDSLWGNVFCKRLYVGSASYHFVSPTESFVSYRHPACRDLPSMDDGTPLPTRIGFHDLDFDPEERRLTATIEWEKDFGTSWNENVRWKLTMHFDTEYMVILKGGIQVEWCQERRARSRPPRRPNPHRPPPVAVYVPPKPDEEERKEEPDRNEEWIMSGYGHDQLYINAALVERYRDPTNSANFRELGQDQCRRLEREGATKRTLGFVQHVFELAADKPNSSPIDFLA